MPTKNAVAAVALLAASLIATAAQAHAKMESSQPKADSEIQGAPKEIRLRFNERLEPAFSKIVLVDAKDATVALPKTAIDKADPTVMFAQVPALQPGQYRVRWSTMTHDGHKTKGEYAFKVK